MVPNSESSPFSGVASGPDSLAHFCVDRNLWVVSGRISIWALPSQETEPPVPDLYLVQS